MHDGYKKEFVQYKGSENYIQRHKFMPRGKKEFVSWLTNRTILTTSYLNKLILYVVDMVQYLIGRQ